MTDFVMTDSAVAQAIKAMQDFDKESCCLRIAVKGGGCSGLSYVMKFDNKKDEDLDFTFGPLTVIIDSKSFLYLKGTTVDYKSGIMESGFSFNNPNAKRTCGCGNSFGA